METRTILATALLTAVSLVRAEAIEVDFSRDIRPILADACFPCHGPDATARQADLRLDLERQAKASRDGGLVIAPGKPHASLLIERILSDDEDQQMPPLDSGRSLTTRQKETLVAWISAGAHWQTHWSFVPPLRVELPIVNDTDWIRQPLDRHVLARIEREALRPAAAATRETLIRRLTLDFTGLPPTAGEVDRFVHDRHPAAYQRLLDRLLASPRYGEAMTHHWLDAARYADTDGYQNDGPRSMWRWRDWVIDAYNDGKPFDQFSIEQLAGDLLPNATSEQRLATGFNRNHRYNSEAGLVLNEFLLENAVDRIDTSATVWMGLTLGCARCHDHKYDPFSQREYYRLISYFDNIPESGRAVKFGNSEPWLITPTREQQQTWDQLTSDLNIARAALAELELQVDEAIAGLESNKTTPVLFADTARHFRERSDESTVESGKPTWGESNGRPTLQLDGQTILKLPGTDGLKCEKRFSVSFWMKPSEVTDGVVMSQQSKNTRRPGIAVKLSRGKLQFFLITRWVSGVAAVETVTSIPTNRWSHIVLINDGSQSARGMNIFIDGKPQPVRILYNTNSNTGGAGKGDPLRLGGGVVGKTYHGELADVRVYNRSLLPDEVTSLSEWQTIPAILSMAGDRRSTLQTNVLRRWFLEHRARSTLKQAATRLTKARRKLRAFVDSLPTTMIMTERAESKTTHVHLRGRYDQLGDVVTSETPMALGNVAAGNRLDFARWLFSESHPLTARVAVNRYWQRLFGTGLVKTAEDFGVQGEAPSHPGLLDFLAVEFRESSWDVKRMQRLIASSATYRQSSAADENKRRIDPENRLLSRGSRKRLPAHVLRDQALALSGLLVERTGGSSVSPYQPANLWREMSNMTYRQSKGQDLYRRSLYTIWKRTVVPPSMALLDAADRESCSVRPKTTNTPLQALTLLNEVTFVEAARNLGTRVLRSGQSPDIETFRRIVGRPPTAKERLIVERAWRVYSKHFASDPAAATRLLAVGESPAPADLAPTSLAAATALANMLLNLDETISKP
ncbi:MAG TPA: DUF1553 domain-containing protein [Planctomycetes bacterium]|nr:DUF1553 domain-containing protein [Planctomycetota bacterium]